MNVIREEDLRRSISDALQFISYYHPADFIRSLAQAYEREQSAAAKAAMGQILRNSRMCALGHRPICQDTGTANVFLKIGMNVRIESRRSLQDIIDDVLKAAAALDADIHADLEEYVRRTGILADRTMPQRTHPRVSQDLPHRRLGRSALLTLVGLGQGANEVSWMVVADELQRIRYAAAQIFLADNVHRSVIAQCER